jgi:SulP family sulfate permease
MWEARATFSPTELSVGAVTLFLLLLWPRFTKKVPAPIVVLPIVTVAILLLQRYLPGEGAATIGSRFSSDVGGTLVRGIPPALPGFQPPWSLSGGLTLHMIRIELSYRRRSPSRFWELSNRCSPQSSPTAWRKRVTTRTASSWRWA